MKTLYFVSKYDFKNNLWIRFLVTARCPEQASKQVADYCEGIDGQLKAPLMVCSTSQDVFMEV